MPLLKWRANFINDLNQYRLGDFAMQPSLTQLFYRNKSSLSYQYWGATDYVPKLTLTAMQNFALLSRGQWEAVAAKKNFVFNLTKLWLDGNNDIFHDYRKAVRYAVEFITSTWGGFPQIVVGNITGPLQVFNQLGHDMGVIHDAIVAFDFYNKTGNFPMAQQKIALIETLWPIEQKWVQQVDLLGQVQAVINALLPIS